MNKAIITRTANKSLLYLKKYSPQILTGFGVVSFGATVYLAAKETLDAPVIIEDHKVFIKINNDAYENEEIDRKEYGKNNLAVWPVKWCRKPHPVMFPWISKDRAV